MVDSQEAFLLLRSAFEWKTKFLKDANALIKEEIRESVRKVFMWTYSVDPHVKALIWKTKIHPLMMVVLKAKRTYDGSEVKSKE